MNILEQSTTRIALIALLGTVPFMTSAQTATEAPAGDTATQTAPVEEEAAPVAPVEGQIVMQSEDTILAEDLIGSSVYSQDGEDIGQIDDLIVDLDGSVEGVVIGVGGFLGIGKKLVAVEMGSVSTQTDELNNVRLVTSATRADLDAAEAFVTAAEQQAAQQSLETAPATDPAMAPAPTTD